MGTRMIFIVTAVDNCPDCHGKAAVLGAYDSLAKAEDIVKKDIEHWAEKNDAVADYTNMTAANDAGCSCCWQIHDQLIYT